MMKDVQDGIRLQRLITAFYKSLQRLEGKEMTPYRSAALKKRFEYLECLVRSMIYDMALEEQNNAKDS